ncbi:MAG TPA: glycosyltransferase family 4 protein, partial [Candidatus Hydrogenedentes bacterium]|nr:glycosyltransferase family 4 protein [Candidatus Hydrogenedentota bacterium]
ADYLAARAYRPKYHARLLASLRTVDAVVVYNSMLKDDLTGFHYRVKVIPSGVRVADYEDLPPPRGLASDRAVILMSGRAEDPLKGLDVLLEAGRRLREHRRDFEVRATHCDPAVSADWFTALGWSDHAEALRLYAAADMVVVPSLWAEPFGIVAVEAMAAGKPVCAGRIGGLRDIVRDGETGFLFEPGDATALARCIERLLDDAPLRERLGAEARRVARDYDWDRIIERHYLPLLEELVRA